MLNRTIGLNRIRNEVWEFILWAPNAGNVELVVNGNQSIVAEKIGSGYWFLQSNDINTGDLYQVNINDKLLPDPASLLQPEGVHGPSAAYDLHSFHWDDIGWKGLREENIFYELHTGTFSGQSDFQGIEKRLDYLKELGINTLEIMPVAQFPGQRNWGYDGVFPFAVQNSYGGPSGLQALVNTCHKKGLAVVLDVVYNHLGPEGNYLNEFGPYFTDEYKTPWGKAINFDREWSDEVRRFYVENMLMWFRDFHIDGLRLDAVHAIKDLSARHIMKEFREKADELEAITGRVYQLIGESDLNDTRYINRFERGGYNLDKQWCDEFHHALHSLLTGERNGYYSDFGEIWHLVKSFNNAYVYNGIYSAHRKRTFGSKTTGIPGNKFIVFTQNHDHVGNRLMGERLGAIIDFEKLKLAAGAMFISPFIPLIFMGEEYNESNPFLYFTSHSDKDLIDLVKKGRMKEFSDFINAPEFPDPQSENVFRDSRLTFSLKGRNRLIFEYYRKLIALKKSHPVWKIYDRDHFNATIAGEKCIQISKRSGSGSIRAFLNFGDTELSFGSEGLEHVLIDSADQRWGGNRRDEGAGENFTVMPWSLIVLSDIPE